jgi:hypothetical protein
MTRSNWWVVAGVVALLVGGAGCNDNPTATAACKGKVGNASACNNCCVMHGAAGDKWVMRECSCFGGK